MQWGADEEFCLANGWTPNLPPEQIRTHWQQFIAAPPRDCLSFVIDLQGRAVGHVDLAFLTPESGEFGIAIGASELWGKGIGAEAGRLMLTHAFDVLKVPLVFAEVHLPNRRSRALMHKIGFMEVGPAGAEEYQGEVVPMIRYEINRHLFSLGRSMDEG